VLGIRALGVACCIDTKTLNPNPPQPQPQPRIPQSHRVLDHVDRLHRRVVGRICIVAVHVIAVHRRHVLVMLHRRSNRSSQRTHLNAAHSRARLRVGMVVVAIHFDRAFDLSADPIANRNSKAPDVKVKACYELHRAASNFLRSPCPISSFHRV